MIEPKDLVGKKLHSCFGKTEHETAIDKIISYIASYPIPGWFCRFTLSETGIDPTLFASMCACGWIDVDYEPTWLFYLSEKTVNRLRGKYESQSTDGLCTTGAGKTS